MTKLGENMKRCHADGCTAEAKKYLVSINVYVCALCYDELKRELKKKDF